MIIALTDDLQRLLQKKLDDGQFPNEEAVIEERSDVFSSKNQVSSAESRAN